MLLSASSMEAPVHFTVDQIASIFPGYQVHHLIGAGGMGAVYQATQLSLERLVAIKILPPEFVRDSALRVLFEEEAKAMARLNHPNLIAVHDFGEIGDIPYIIMEYVHGCSLHHSARGMVIDPAEVTRIIMGVCAGLAYAHQHGVVHCDIKPANILLTQQVQPKIGDFGLARRTGPSESADSPAYGSEHYSAPEIMQRAAKVDARADIYSTGVILHELLTGRCPADDPRGASAQSRCDPRFDVIIKRATMPDPALRYASIREMADALAEIPAIPAAANAAAERKQQARTASGKPQDPPERSGSSAKANTDPPKSKPKSRRTLSRSGLWMALGLVGLLGAVAAVGMALKRPSSTGIASDKVKDPEPAPREQPAATSNTVSRPVEGGKAKPTVDDTWPRSMPGVSSANDQAKPEGAGEKTSQPDSWTVETPQARGPNRSIDTGHPVVWLSLRKADMKIMPPPGGKIWWVTDQMRTDNARANRFPTIVDYAKQNPDFADVLLFAHPPTTIEFTTTNAVTRFRCKAFLGRAKGDVVFKVIVDGKTVKTLQLYGEVLSQDMECTFSPTRSVTLVTDPNGENWSDWSMWINPEVR